MESIAPGIRVVAVRTPTLPPATHTNAWVLGAGALTVVDPASPWPEEQALLADALRASGERVERILLTHHHVDHVGGAVALASALSVPIVAHAATAALVGFPVDAIVADGDVIEAGDHAFVARHTPGHAPGHLALHDPQTGAVVAGDLVAGIGTILVEPDDGDLALYLASLEAVRALRPSVLLPAHGPALHQADAVLSFYVAHRHARTEQIRKALDQAGQASALDLARAVYGHEVPPQIIPIAARQVVSHLRWLASHGFARRLEEPGDVGIVREIWRAA